MSWWEKPCCIGGDFNAIQYPSERLEDTCYSSTMRDLTDFIFETGSWTFLLWVASSLGPIIRMINVGEELIDFYSPVTGKNIFLMQFRALPLGS